MKKNHAVIFDLDEIDGDFGEYKRRRRYPLGKCLSYVLTFLAGALVGSAIIVTVISKIVGI